MPLPDKVLHAALGKIRDRLDGLARFSGKVAKPSFSFAEQLKCGMFYALKKLQLD